MRKLDGEYVILENHPDFGEIVYGRKGAFKQFANISDKIEVPSVENALKLLFARSDTESPDASDIFTQLNGSLQRLNESITKSEQFCSMLNDFLILFEKDRDEGGSTSHE